MNPYEAPRQASQSPGGNSGGLAFVAGLGCLIHGANAIFAAQWLFFPLERLARNNATWSEADAWTALFVSPAAIILMLVAVAATRQRW